MLKREKTLNYFLKPILLLFILQSCLNYKTSYKMNYKINFYTNYNQFYLFDKASPGRMDSDDFWTPKAQDDRLALEEGVLGIGTECYGHVKGELDILEKENTKFDSEQYDHIVEGGIEIKSGILQIIDCPNSEIEAEANMNPGTYRVRVYSSNLKSIEADENEGHDYYKIEIWPNTNMERKVLKRYSRHKK